MPFSTWIIYAAVAFAAIVSPGPAIFLAISNSVAFGWRRVAFSSLGNVLGLLVVSGLAMAGLGALMKTSDETRSAWFNRVSGSVFFLPGLGMLRLKAGRA